MGEFTVRWPVCNRATTLPSEQTPLLMLAALRFTPFGGTAVADSSCSGALWNTRSYDLKSFEDE